MTPNVCAVCGAKYVDHACPSCGCQDVVAPDPAPQPAATTAAQPPSQNARQKRAEKE